MTKDNDAPPTLPAPKAGVEAKAAPKVAPKEQKDKLAALKAKKQASRPAAKLTLGIKRDGKYEFVKKEFTSLEDAMKDLVAAVKAKAGKGLHEVILGIR